VKHTPDFKLELSEADTESVTFAWPFFGGGFQRSVGSVTISRATWENLGRPTKVEVDVTPVDGRSS